MTAVLHMLDGSIRTHEIYGGWLEPDEMILDGVRFVRIGKLEYRETKKED